MVGFGDAFATTWLLRLRLESLVAVEVLSLSSLERGGGRGGTGGGGEEDEAMVEDSRKREDEARPRK